MAARNRSLGAIVSEFRKMISEVSLRQLQDKEIRFSARLNRAILVLSHFAEPGNAAAEIAHGMTTAGQKGATERRNSTTRRKKGRSKYGKKGPAAR